MSCGLIRNMPETEIPGWECCRCGYKWPKKNNADGKPTVCANQKCKSPYWDKAKRLEDYGKEDKEV